MKTERAASVRRVKELISISQKAGLRSLKVGDIELEFGPNHRPKQAIDIADKPTQTNQDPIPSDEELLNWSSPHYDLMNPERP